MPDCSLIHTNSAVAHLTKLSQQSLGRLAVWPFCSSNFDAASAGWQIPSGDEQGFAALRDLFTRPCDPLRTALLNPQYVTPHDGVFYDRHDASEFAAALCEAEEIVVLAPGSRCLAGPNALPQDGREFFQTWPCASPSKRVTLVASDPDNPIPDFAWEFGQSYATVWWQSADGWEQL